MGSLAVPANGLNMHPLAESPNSNTHANLATCKLNVVTPIDKPKAATCYQRYVTAVQGLRRYPLNVGR